MAGKITRLAFQKHAADRVNVYLDGQYAFALPALDAARLGMGEYLDDDAIARLQTQDERQKAYDRALRFLSFRPRSQAEVRRNLLAAGLDAELVEATLARLAAQGYLDDAEFARFWVENRQQFRPKGSVALRGELRRARRGRGNGRCRAERPRSGGRRLRGGPPAGGPAGRAGAG